MISGDEAMMSVPLDVWRAVNSASPGSPAWVAAMQKIYLCALSAARADGYRAGQLAMRERAAVIMDAMSGTAMAAAVGALPIEPEGKS